MIQQLQSPLQLLWPEPPLASPMSSHGEPARSSEAAPTSANARDAQSVFAHKVSRCCVDTADLNLLDPADERNEAQRDGETPTACQLTALRFGQGVGIASSHSVDVPLRLAFVYGTLKRGFGNHWLVEELMHEGHARYVGTARSKKQYPLVCGPFQVPFLLDFPSSGHYVRGELYQVDGLAIARLDKLEGVTLGHYERRPMVVTGLQLHNAKEWDIALDSACPESLAVIAEAYFAASSYSRCMARAPHIPCYTEKETLTYIRRKDRPQNRTFLEHIFTWIEEEGFTSPSQVTKEDDIIGFSRVSPDS